MPQTRGAAIFGVLAASSDVQSSTLTNNEPAVSCWPMFNLKLLNRASACSSFFASRHSRLSVSSRLGSTSRLGLALRQVRRHPSRPAFSSSAVAAYLRTTSAPPSSSVLNTCSVPATGRVPIAISFVFGLFPNPVRQAAYMRAGCCHCAISSATKAVGLSPWRDFGRAATQRTTAPPALTLACWGEFDTNQPSPRHASISSTISRACACRRAHHGDLGAGLVQRPAGQIRPRDKARRGRLPASSSHGCRDRLNPGPPRRPRRADAATGPPSTVRPPRPPTEPASSPPNPRASWWTDRHYPPGPPWARNVGDAIDGVRRGSRTPHRQQVARGVWWT